MKEYVEKDRVIGLLGKNWRCNVDANDAMQESIDDVRKLPAADVREVVLCRECANRFMTPNGWRCHYAEWAIEDDDFCSCGVNKGVADNV